MSSNQDEKHNGQSEDIGGGDCILEAKEDDNAGEDERPTPKLLFFLIGNVSLLAFNIFINALNIFSKITGKPTIADDVNRAYNIPCSITALILCFFKPSNYKIFLCGSMGLAGLLMCVIPFFIIFSIEASIVYWLCLISIGIIGILGSIVFNCAFSFAARFDNATGAVSSGCGCCGVIASVLSILAFAASTPKTENVFNCVYFYFAAVIIFGTMGYVLFMSRDPFIGSRMVGNTDEPTPSVFSKMTLDVIKVIWTQWFSVFCNFMITLSLFPGYVTRTIEGPLGAWKNIIIPTAFCVFDWVGRALPSLGLWPGPKFAWAPIAARFLFFPIYMLSIQGVVNLGEPWWTIVWMIPFAISNGYCGTVQIIYGSTREELQGGEAQRYAGFLMGFSVNAGILVAMGVNAIMNASLGLS